MSLRRRLTHAIACTLLTRPHPADRRARIKFAREYPKTRAFIDALKTVAPRGERMRKEVA